MKTLKEIKENKIQLEKELKVLIEKFESENEVFVNDIHFYETARTISENKPLNTLRVDIKL